MRRTARSLGAIALGLVFLGAIVTLAAAESRSAHYPARSGGLTSPDGRYVLLNIDNETDNQVQYLGDNHALYLIDLKFARLRKVHAYGRSVVVSWSPRGSAFYINDRTGSNSSNVIFYLVSIGKAINLSEEFRQRVTQKSVERNHHVYFEATEWLTENTVKLKIHGYGDVDPNGFELWYEYRPSRGFRLLK